MWGPQNMLTKVSADSDTVRFTDHYKGKTHINRDTGTETIQDNGIEPTVVLCMGFCDSGFMSQGPVWRQEPHKLLE